MLELVMQGLLFDAGLPATEADFRAWYAAYPSGRKTRSTAQRAWTKARQERRLPSLEKLLENLEQWKSCEQWQDTRFIPHATTFINQSRWDSDPPGKIQRAVRRATGNFAKEDYDAFDR